ncbi:MAG: hypothetical protein ACE5EZ_05240 [Thermodesulfobacteriota bacterium]
MRIFLITLLAAIVLALYPGCRYSAALTEAPGGKAGAETVTKPAASGVPVKPAAPAGTPDGSSQDPGIPSGSGFFTGNYEIGDAANGIGFSRHNLGRYGGATQTESTFDICVYCHTPHTPTKNSPPLWAGKDSLPTHYTAYGTKNLETKPSRVGLGSPSLACLSCHDGMAAPDSIANSPGKKREAPAKTPMAWKFPLTESSMDQTVVSTRILLAPLLTDDHPVNVLFRGGQVASLRPSRTIISQINLSSGLRLKNRQRLSNLWSIKGYISDTATIGDLLRDGRIECSSCHDPHFNNKSWAEAANTFRDWDDMDGLFLRRIGGNFASGVCRTCHQK